MIEFSCMAQALKVEHEDVLGARAVHIKQLEDEQSEIRVNTAKCAAEQMIL